MRGFLPAQGAPPEPPTILLIGLAALVPALVAFWLRRRKKSRHAASGTR